MGFPMGRDAACLATRAASRSLSPQTPRIHRTTCVSGQASNAGMGLGRRVATTRALWQPGVRETPALLPVLLLSRSQIGCSSNTTRASQAKLCCFRASQRRHSFDRPPEDEMLAPGESDAYPRGQAACHPSTPRGRCTSPSDSESRRQPACTRYAQSGAGSGTRTTTLLGSWRRPSWSQPAETRSPHRFPSITTPRKHAKPPGSTKRHRVITKLSELGAAGRNLARAGCGRQIASAGVRQRTLVEELSLIHI